MSESERGDFGGAVAPVLDVVVKEGISAVSVAAAGSKVSFLDAWIKKFKTHARHLKSKGEILEAPAVVVFTEDCFALSKNTSWRRRPLLGTSSITESYAGNLYVGTAEVGGYAYHAKVNCPDDISDAIYEQDLQDSLIIMLCDLDSIRIWHAGLENDSDVVTISQYPAALTQKMIDSDLMVYYEQEARQCTKWWKDSKERITVESPERVVQDSLRLFLVGRYADIAKVREEVISGNGRADITIREVGRGSHSAVLELKTTRESRTPRRPGSSIKRMSEKLNVRWATSGVQQAAAYRDLEGFSGAFLCVYDFTKNYRSSIEAAIQKTASKYAVEARLYWIAASHEEHRNERYPVSAD